MVYGKTVIATRSSFYGGTLFTSTGTRLLCADGKIRAAAHIAAVADTYFSIPAAVRVRGVRVRGYATTEESDGRRAYVFRAHADETTLPRWPDVFTREHAALVLSAHE